MKNKFALVAVILFLLAGRLHAEPFRLAVIPDTQFASQKWPDVLTSSMKWIAENAKQQKIEYALHVGDMVQTGNDEREWKNFDAAISLLDGKVPYILAAGNHDSEDSRGNGGFATFNKFFPLSRFEKLPGFGGTFSKTSNDNTYHTFTAGGIDWLVVALQYNPTDEQLQWASDVVAKNLQRQVIVLTHDYISHRGRRPVGERVWTKLAKPHENVLMVICGHIATTHSTDTGSNGNTVYEMLFDWQNSKQKDNNSYFAILEIDPEKGTISAKAYSPMLDEWKTDPKSQFEFKDVKFITNDKQPKE